MSKRGHTDDQLMTHAEVRRLMKAMGRSTTGVRNRALTVVLWRTGLRCQEAVDLLLRDIDVDGSKVHVRKGKGGVARSVPIDASAMTYVELWLARRRDLIDLRSQVVFCTHGGKKLASTYVRRMFRERAQKAGIARPYLRVHPHGFRHLYASDLHQLGMELRTIQKYLGHAEIEYTFAYLRRFPDGAGEELIASRDPIDED